MINGVTKSGFEFSIDKDVMNDMEIVDALADSMSDNALERLTGVSMLCKKILGKDKKRLYDHIRTDKGKVPTEAIETEILEIFHALGTQAKN